MSAHSRTRLALVLTLALPATAAAQAPVAATTLDQVIVTGTRASDRTVLESTSPVDVLTAEDLRRATGPSGELGSALQALLPSFNFPRQSNSGGADHVRAAQLRGLSPDQVLVLVNGRRRHTSAVVSTDSKIGRGTTPVDFNAIPVGAVARIEVLRDGAGAQYGSDAVAGVVNIILAGGAEGGALEAGYGLHHTRLEPIGRRLSDGQTGHAHGQAGIALGDGGFLRLGAGYQQRNATNRAGFDQVPPWDQTPANLAVQGRRNYHLGDGDSRQLDGWFNAELPLPGDAALYGFGTWHQRDTEGANYYRYPEGEANWPQVYPHGYRPVSVGENLDVGLVAGVRGRLGAWDYDASLDHGANEFTYRLRESLNASLGPDSPTRFRVADYRFAQTLANLDFSRGFAGAGADHVLALGAEFRAERYQTGAGDPASYAAGPYRDRPAGAQAGGGLTPQDQANLRREVASAYATVSSSFGEAFSTDLSARYEHYQDFGGQFTGKLAARHAFTPRLALRGTLSSNFRAPSLAQVGFESTSTGYNAAGQLVQGRLLAVANPIARALGARDLDPEQSRNLGLGLAARIGERLDLSLDLFQIEIDDRIALSEAITGDALAAFVAANFDVPALESAQFFVNAADTRTRGAELVANWRDHLAGGRLLLTGAWSYAKTELEHIVATPPQLSALDPSYVLFGVEERNTLTDAAPRTRALLSASWAGHRWNLLARVQRHGSARRVFDFGGGFQPEQRYGAEWQLDAEVEYAPAPGWSLALGGSNLTDAYPDRSNEDIHYFGNLPYDVLSPLGSNGRYLYGRVRYAF
ncbi:TonB-dependent receptor [Pseudoxanthomonas sp. SGNA-20]|jgi:Outer membrane receptor for ferrienterochelin and colicins|uniref:TonB-dependent receptor plug domain-containing protein n=1 Tax=unclassified Pseudoxanthomonas TaxID=2645906 RepID=UPI0002FFAE1C|nr:MULTISPECIES: TonB-dependent receptor [unclassified Pseudoxanthomonas]RRN58878.1 TonB-dependent receptor [Pseudoxanthomonas sp. SGNA-20]